jgi:DNA-binding IclR family transcriptional regulator
MKLIESQLHSDNGELTDERDSPDGRAPAVTKAVQILRYLARTPEPIGVNSLATALGIVPSTCLHILRALVREGLVAFDISSKRYRLGIGVLGLASTYITRSPLPTIVQPLLDDIARRLGVTASLIDRIDEHELIVSASAQGSDMFSVKVTVGSTFPSFSSASGRCVAAYSGQSRTALRARFAKLHWQDAPTFKRWTAEVDAVKVKGYAIDAGSYIRGLTSISVPVVKPGGVLARCVAVIALKDQLSDAKISVLVAEATSVAKELQKAEF